MGTFPLPEEIWIWFGIGHSIIPPRAYGGLVLLPTRLGQSDNDGHAPNKRWFCRGVLDNAFRYTCAVSSGASQSNSDLPIIEYDAGTTSIEAGFTSSGTTGLRQDERGRDATDDS